MNKAELKANLDYLVSKYIIDEQMKKELQKYINNLKVKYILGEIDQNKRKEYTKTDKELIKEIYFYYC